MSELNGIYNGIDTTIRELIEEYENQEVYATRDGCRNEGAVTALERLLKILNQ